MNEVVGEIEAAQAFLSSGRPERAVSLLTDVLSRAGPSPQLLYGLALARQSAHDAAGAIDSYRQCVQLYPQFAEAHNNLGTALYKQGRVEESIECFRAALVAKPDYVRALTNLGNSLRRIQQFDAAADALERALALTPEYPPALCNLAQTMLDQRHFKEAISLFSRALAAHPQLPDAHHGLGVALYSSGECAQAIASFDRAIALFPNHRDAHIHRGNALRKLDEPEQALLSYERALQLDPRAGDVWFCRGFVLSSLFRYQEAIDSYERALTFAPELALARWNQGLLRLLLGDFHNGWRLFETRFDSQAAQEAENAIPYPRWHVGLPLEGRKIWVRAETGDGMGDAIQFSRYVKTLQALGAQVVFETRPSLWALMRTLGPGLQLLEPGERVESADYHCPLMSLPFAFGTDAQNIPTEKSYLKAEPDRVARWSSQLGSGLRVGIAWRGAAKHDIWELKGRSVPLREFRALLSVPGVQLIALQKGTGLQELAEVGFGDRLISFGEALDEGEDAFLDTAAIMTSLDLVISIDTSIAHLAGALGVPVWVALKKRCDWRWQLDREDCPWYPSMRLFRQSRPGDWTSVVQSMAEQLQNIKAQP